MRMPVAATMPNITSPATIISTPRLRSPRFTIA